MIVNNVAKGYIITTLPQKMSIAELDAAEWIKTSKKIKNNNKKKVGGGISSTLAVYYRLDWGLSCQT